MITKLVSKSTSRGRRKPKPDPNPKPPEVPPDPWAAIAQSRAQERAEVFKARQQLDNMILESQRRIQASRAKFYLARMKLINKVLDD